jgi:glycosyltransferase involved in cell wall biosynthesis
LVPFEALLCGTPVIVTENTGMGEIIKKAQAGMTVPQNDPKALADAIAWVLDNPKFAEQQVNKGQQFIRENLNWSKIALDYECLYQQMIDA